MINEPKQIDPREREAPSSPLFKPICTGAWKKYHCPMTAPAITPPKFLITLVVQYHENNK